METIPRLAILLAVLYVCSEARMPWFFRGRLREGAVKPPDLHDLSRAELLDLMRNPREAQWFEQKLDHFNPADTRTWRQRFFKAGPASSDALFVMIGGEGAASEYWMDSGMWTKYAKSHNAVRLQLEHRYYGASHPTKDLSVENLQFLSSEQALADLAVFISVKKAEFQAKKVIVVGGSYSGNLAGWFRIKYPHLADGALATSAPVQAQVNFKGYMEVVAQSLSLYQPANSCNDAIRIATKALDEKLKTEQGRKELKKQFNLCDDIDPSVEDDVHNLCEALAGNFMGVVQYNNIDPSQPNITNVCDKMVDKSNKDSALERYAKVNELFTQGECLDFKYSKLVNMLKEESWKAISSGVGYRQWIYQTCTEFGFYQSSDSNDQPFSHDFPIDSQTKLCTDVYGSKFSPRFISGAVNATNFIYGGRRYTEDRVVFTNGNIDPWHYLSIIEPLPQAPVIYINGTAHCANMYTQRPNDPPGLIQARKTIAGLITKWLK